MALPAVRKMINNVPLLWERPYRPEHGLEKNYQIALFNSISYGLRFSCAAKFFSMALEYGPRLQTLGTERSVAIRHLVYYGSNLVLCTFRKKRLALPS